MARGRGYLVAAIGCVIGGGILLVIGVWLGVLYAEKLMPDEGLGAILPAFLGGVAGVALGAGGGTWLALKLRGHHGAFATAILTGGLAPFVAVGASFLGDYLAGDATGTDAELWFSGSLATASIAAVAIGVRALVARGRGSDWDSAPS